MENSPLVSVIIPAYNAERFIERTLHSVFEQTYQNLEIIVVDDGSTDSTASIIEQMACGDDRITLIQQENQGVVAARNHAISRAQGRYVAPLDNDDIWLPRKIERQVRAMEAAGERAGFAYTWWIALDEEDRITGSSNRWRLSGDIFAPLLFDNFIGNASIPLIRRAALEQTGYYEELGCEDYDLTLRLAAEFDVVAVPYFLTGYRHVTGGLSSYHNRNGRAFDSMLAKLRRRYPDLPDRLFNWSRSRFYQHLTAVSYNLGDFRGALQWGLRAIRWDPLAILSYGLLRQLLFGSVRLALTPLTSLIWPDRQSWLHFRRRTRRAARRTYTMEEVESGTARPELPWSDAFWRPYDRLCRHRMRMLASSDDGPSGDPKRAGRTASATSRIHQSAGLP